MEVSSRAIFKVTDRRRECPVVVVARGGGDDNESVLRRSL